MSGQAERELHIGVGGKNPGALWGPNKAAGLGRGDLTGVDTPARAGCMERAAADSVRNLLPAGRTTVGVRLSLAHTAATPVGMEVRCESELVAMDGRLLTFSIVGYDDAGEIGRAEHVRAIVDAERFLAKTEGKRDL